MKKSFLATLALAACVSGASLAQNPYLPLWEFIPDGEPYVFEDPDKPGEYRVYIYGSHDILVKNYCGRDQVVWSASVNDLTHWRYDGVIFELKKDGADNLIHQDGVGEVLYAPDVAMKKGPDGKPEYYLYPNVQGERGNIVAKSNRPDGPFVACNWNPENLRLAVGPFGFDPAAFVDDDGRAYGYWGFGHSFAAELDPATMATVKPGTEIVQNMIPGFEDDNHYKFFEASSIRKIKDKYVFVYSRFTANGENEMPTSNYTLAYCFSNSPLGPWTYGGTIIDGRALERNAEGKMVATACPYGNTHGSICEINGKWWVFYHRQAGTCEYSRQATVAPIDVTVIEGEDGFVKISEAEFTSEGFMTEGLDPLTRYSAGIACYYTQPKPAVQNYPNVNYFGSHIEIVRGQADFNKDPYDLSINKCLMVDNTAGSVFGYKYFNFSKTYGKSKLKLNINYRPEGVKGTMEIYLDRPSESEGGVKIGSLQIPAQKSEKDISADIAVENLKYFNGKHALFFVFKSDTKDKSLCTVSDLMFK